MALLYDRDSLAWLDGVSAIARAVALQFQLRDEAVEHRRGN